MSINPLVRSVLESTRPKYDAPLYLTGSLLVLSDVEVPFHNSEFVNGCIAVAHGFGVHTAIALGDWIHAESLSPFPGGDKDIDKELGEIDDYLGGFLEAFERIYYVMGNHDQRVQRVFDGKVSNEKALRLILSDENIVTWRRKVVMSEYFWCKAAGNWLFEHQKNNSTIPSRVAQALSAKFHCNVITAHTHKVGMVRVNDYWAIDSGCGVDVTRLAYPNLRHSTHTAMQNGAVLMLWQGDRYNPLLLTPETMDFNLWLAQNRA